MSTTLYVIEQVKWPATGDIGGVLMTADGEAIHSHVSSSSSWLFRDLTVNFGRDGLLAERFGSYEVKHVHLGAEPPAEIAHLFTKGDES